MMGRHPRRALLSIAGFLALSGCVGVLNAYGLRANIEAQEERLQSEEVEDLRRVTREIANEEGLVELEDHKGEEPGDEIYDFYTVLTAPSKNVALYVSKDRYHAHIQVDDWNSTGEPNQWTRSTMDRVLEVLRNDLPERSVELETRDMGFWRP